MNYSQIRKMDISNGSGIGVSLFVSGCNFHCKNCFNKETWDFNAGEPFTSEVEEKFLDLADKPYIERISILGGEPLAVQNIETVKSLLRHIRARFGEEKKVWLYTGNTFSDVYSRSPALLALVDVLVDGRFEDDKKDLSLHFRGSSNQRVIDVVETLMKKEIILLDV